MRMLEKDTADSDAPVTLADQQNINAFSRFNNRADEVIDRLEALKREIEELEEAETEMELMDDEEMVMYKLDSSLLHLPAARVLELLQKSLEEIRSKTAKLETEKSECETGMANLKEVLYAKFGKAINLER